MKKNIKATSIVEAMVVLVVVTIAVTGAYDMFSKSIRITDSNGYKLQAISIAKEGIEAMTNIRDTNWKVLPGDYTNCWNTLNYNVLCHNESNTTYDIPDGESFYIWKDSDYRWKLTQTGSTLTYSSPVYRNNFKVGYDSIGFYTQSGGLIDTSNPLKPYFTREIKVKYIEDGYDNPTTGPIESTIYAGSNEQKMQVTSLVQWKDPSGDNIKKVELTTVLSNWRNKN